MGLGCAAATIGALGLLAAMIGLSVGDCDSGRIGSWTRITGAKVAALVRALARSESECVCAANVGSNGAADRMAGRRDCFGAAERAWPDVVAGSAGGAVSDGNGIASAATTRALGASSDWGGAAV
ncbi:MAG: hypothetical protein O3C40_35425 [Planctomycetota bacterium]|nr:hypothetical protein [Planctomycetota bacterium]